MINAMDVAYALAGAAAAPLWLLSARRRAKLRDVAATRLGRVPPRPGGGAAVLLHAVSVGEVNATRALIDALRRERPALGIVLTVTTRTGYDRALELFGAAPGVLVARYPLDFSGAVRRLLDATRPSLAVLMELEVWPNFTRACRRRGIPIVLANGRLTEASARRYAWGGPLARRMFARLSAVCAQDEEYAARFARLGVPAARLHVAGTMKFDTAPSDERVAGDLAMARDLGLDPAAETILVCGSSGPGEEPLLLDAYEALRRERSDLRLVIVPRKPERFDEVAQLIARRGHAVTRRSAPGSARPAAANADPPVVLLDTMGELRKAYSVADLVVVGRSLVDLGQRQRGSDMIEPAALGRAVVVGPFTQNFAEAMRLLRKAGGVVEVASPRDLTGALRRLLSDEQGRAALGRAAREAVQQARGSTSRHLQVILPLLDEQTETSGSRG